MSRTDCITTIIVNYIRSNKSDANKFKSVNIIVGFNNEYDDSIDNVKSLTLYNPQYGAVHVNNMFNKGVFTYSNVETTDPVLTVVPNIGYFDPNVIIVYLKYLSSKNVDNCQLDIVESIKEKKFTLEKTAFNNFYYICYDNNYMHINDIDNMLLHKYNMLSNCKKYMDMFDNFRKNTRFVKLQRYTPFVIYFTNKVMQKYDITKINKNNNFNHLIHFAYHDNGNSSRDECITLSLVNDYEKIKELSNQMKTDTCKFVLSIILKDTSKYKITFIEQSEKQQKNYFGLNNYCGDLTSLINNYTQRVSEIILPKSDSVQQMFENIFGQGTSKKYLAGPQYIVSNRVTSHNSIKLLWKYVSNEEYKLYNNIGLVRTVNQNVNYNMNNNTVMNFDLSQVNIGNYIFDSKTNMLHIIILKMIINDNKLYKWGVRSQLYNEKTLLNNDNQNKFNEQYVKNGINHNEISDKFIYTPLFTIYLKLQIMNVVNNVSEFKKLISDITDMCEKHKTGTKHIIEPLININDVNNLLTKELMNVLEKTFDIFMINFKPNEEQKPTTPVLSNWNVVASSSSSSSSQSEQSDSATKQNDTDKFNDMLYLKRVMSDIYEPSTPVTIAFTQVYSDDDDKDGDEKDSWM